MNTQLAIIKDNESTLLEIESLKKFCNSLAKTPHYAKLGEAGIFAISQKAKSIGMDRNDALNGGMYYVQGKVEMQGQAMLAIIRSRGHSIKLDSKSTDTHVFMTGKRQDNGDEWEVDFSIEDAKRAGIYRGQWEKYPKVMCMWRCVSMLGRFLFSDILKGVYVQGEISEGVAFDKNDYVETKTETPKQKQIEKITLEQAEELSNILEECSEAYQKTVLLFMERNLIKTLNDLPVDTHARLKPAAEKNRIENLKEQELKSEKVEVLQTSGV